MNCLQSSYYYTNLSAHPHTWNSRAAMNQVLPWNHFCFGVIFILTDGWMAGKLVVKLGVACSFWCSPSHALWLQPLHHSRAKETEHAANSRQVLSWAGALLAWRYKKWLVTLSTKTLRVRKLLAWASNHIFLMIAPLGAQVSCKGGQDFHQKWGGCAAWSCWPTPRTTFAVDVGPWRCPVGPKT